MKCYLCKYAFPVVRDKEILYYQCRRYAPKLITRNGYPYTEFPIVSGNHWCGEFEPLDEIKKDENGEY